MKTLYRKNYVSLGGKRPFSALLFILLLLLLAACGGGDEAADVPDADVAAPANTPAPPTDVPAPPTETPVPETNAVSDLESVQNAVVQIVAQGSFADIKEGMQLNTAGSGSGFIIDESGIAITNHHVVGGAALIKVYVQGEDQPRNAKIIGISECSDLAVIDIDGDDFPYLEWHEGDINVGLDVYTAGFPLGNPEFTLTRGVVSKAQANGETIWASVDAVLEHDATINPGNSGGPLVDSDGRVVGINYAGNLDANQYFAINRDEALPIIEQLEAGQDVTSIGVNGFAASNDSGLSGIWVSAVESGSPADAAGVEPGDIITSLQGLVLATDGTMSDYCDILRTHNADDTMDIQVLRYETQEVLEGQLNGRELEQSFSFAQELNEDVSNDSAASYSRYMTITDDTKLLSVDVPVEWSDVDGSLWVSSSDETLGVALRASSNLDDYYSSWALPGIVVRASATLGDIAVPDALDTLDNAESCSYDSRYDFENSLYAGAYDVWENCGDANSTYLVLAAKPADTNDVLILVMINIISDADLNALDRILGSFTLNLDG